MNYDYLIIGQGLAGSVLGYQLIKRGKRLAIIDEKKPFSSSTVAAGLANPFTGPNMVKSWKAEILFPYLKSFYRAIEKETNSKFFNNRIIFRPFNSVEDLNDWEGRSVLPNYKKFIHQILGSDVHSQFIHNPYGGMEIHGFVLNVPLFVKAMENYLRGRCNFSINRFDEAKLEVSNQSVRYQGIQAKNIIFCSGYQLRESEFFDWLPMAPVKGELLHLKLDAEFETIYNKSCFIIPQGNGSYKAGSTYNRYDLTELPTEQGKNEITKKLSALLKMNYEVVDHVAGIRPGTVSRRPLIGFHPVYRQMSVFNGLGTKGVTLAPFFSEQFVKCLEDGNNLEQEVDIKKYYSLYFKSHFSRGN